MLPDLIKHQTASRSVKLGPIKIFHQYDRAPQLHGSKSVVRLDKHLLQKLQKNQISDDNNMVNLKSEAEVPLL